MSSSRPLSFLKSSLVGDPCFTVLDSCIDNTRSWLKIDEHLEENKCCEATFIKRSINFWSRSSIVKARVQYSLKYIHSKCTILAFFAEHGAHCRIQNACLDLCWMNLNILGILSTRSGRTCRQLPLTVSTSLK